MRGRAPRALRDSATVSTRIRAGASSASSGFRWRGIPGREPPARLSIDDAARVSRDSSTRPTPPAAARGRTRLRPAGPDASPTRRGDASPTRRAGRVSDPPGSRRVRPSSPWRVRPSSPGVSALFALACPAPLRLACRPSSPLFAALQCRLASSGRHCERPSCSCNCVSSSSRSPSPRPRMPGPPTCAN